MQIVALTLLVAVSLGGQTAPQTTLCAAPVKPSATLPGFRKSPWFGEQIREEWVVEGVRVLAIAPGSYDVKKPTRLVIFATPNGNTIEQTLGCAAAKGIDWHFDIQQVAAQVRKLRVLSQEQNVVLACTEADTLSWPAWKAKQNEVKQGKNIQNNGPAEVRKVVELIRRWFPGGTLHIDLAGHSGGGSFLFGYIDGGPDIPAEVERIVFLDANYSYNDSDKHGDKLLAWLKGDRGRRLVVIAYDDRKIRLNGKLVIGPTGGTYRATMERMIPRFARDVPLTEATAGDFVNHIGMDGQVAFHVHTNPSNKILHTALVGEMNGLLCGLADFHANQAWGKLGGPRAFMDWVQPAPGIPARPADSEGGVAFFKKLAKCQAMGGTPNYEEAVVAEVLRGNVPDLRKFQKITLRAKDAIGKEHTAVIEVMPDYLAVGSDADFVRVPIMPTSAAQVADAFGCALPTRKIASEIFKAATVKLAPRPLPDHNVMTMASTFLEHNQIIEKQRAGKRLGDLVAGDKKDVVISNLLGGRPNHVAIYGWHQLNGQAIQPLTAVHANTWVDYSHGIRLMKRTVLVDGKPRDVRAVLYSADLAPLLSDEGPVIHPTY